MLEYRAFELTQANLAVLASQHNPQAVLNRGNKEKFEAPDLLLPSMQKPVAQHSHLHITNADGGEADFEEEDYGEEYDDTRTFTVKDFKEQALRYAKDHFSSNHPHNTTNSGGAGSTSEIGNTSNLISGNPFRAAAH